MVIEKQPKLSVVIPVYNVETYLQRCLDSITNQTYTNLEIICVNDGSTDGSLKILEDYARKDSRVQIVTKANGGLVSARKAGVQAATGRYATYVDSDDYIEPVMYDELVHIMMEQDVDVVTSGCIRDYGEKKVVEPEDIKPGKYYGDSLHDLLGNLIATDKFFKYNMSCHVINKIFKTELLKTHQLNVSNDISVGEDAAVVYPLIHDVKSVFVSGNNYYHYCIRTDSVMGMQIIGRDDPVYRMLDYIANCLSDANGIIKSSFKKQYELFSLYMRLLRDPASVLRYDDGRLIPFGIINKEDRIVLYGAGKFGKALKQFLDENGFKNIIWVDQNVKQNGVITWKEAVRLPYDRIIISALIYETVQSMLSTFDKKEDSDKVMYISLF